MAYRSILITLTLFFVFLSEIATAQLFAPTANSRIKTSFGDSCYIFCGNRNQELASLMAKAPKNVPSTFTWEKYDTLSASFNSFKIESDNVLASTISNLTDGCYRVTIKDTNAVTVTYKAWALNNWIEVTNTEIPDSLSNCKEFRIFADFESAPLRVFNTVNNQGISLIDKNKDFDFLWTQKDEVVSSALSPYVYDLVASNNTVKHELAITDKFGCVGKGSVDYYSKIPKSDFTIDPMKGEAVLPIQVNNSSINYDSTIWFFYKDDAQISREIEAAKGETVDSIDFILFDDQPTHEYERSGQYRIKLVTVKVNATGNCYDTLRMKPGTFVDVDTSYIDVPNVFTPNADGANDEFVIKTTSLKSLTIKIYNRWGGLVHSWKYSNIRSSDYTYEHSVWDGKIGNRMATPGVYFYVIRAVGRDLDEKGKEKTISKEGFVHLFRDKD
jgi:gliding motility-associated-like protein